MSTHRVEHWIDGTTRCGLTGVHSVNTDWAHVTCEDCLRTPPGGPQSMRCPGCGRLLHVTVTELNGTTWRYWDCDECGAHGSIADKGRLNIGIENHPLGILRIDSGPLARNHLEIFRESFEGLITTQEPPMPDTSNEPVDEISASEIGQLVTERTRVWITQQALAGSTRPAAVIAGILDRECPPPLLAKTIHLIIEAVDLDNGNRRTIVEYEDRIEILVDAAAGRLSAGTFVIDADGNGSWVRGGRSA